MTAVQHEQTLSPLAAFYRQVEQQPHQVCFVQPGNDGSVEELSWREVVTQVRELAAYLQSLNLEPGSRIALMSSNCCHWIIADIAIWMAGHATIAGACCTVLKAVFDEQFVFPDPVQATAETCSFGAHAARPSISLASSR